MKNKIAITLLLSFLFLASHAQNIHRTACEGNIQRLDSLLKTADIDTANNTGTTLLMAAAVCRQQETFDFLMEKQADVHAVNSFGNSALLYAAQSRNAAMLRSLLQKGAAVNLVNENGETPLYKAVQANNQELFDMLLEAGADVNLGNTALHMAVQRDNLDFVKRLVNEGIYVDSINSYGNTALAIALREEASGITEFLLANGADKGKVRDYQLRGEYLGENKPGTEAVMFAPGFVSTEDFNHTPAFSPDETELYFTNESSKGAVIMVSRLENGIWTFPEAADVEGEYREIDPFITFDGQRMYYNSNRPVEGDSAGNSVDMWYVEREGKGWGAPQHLGGVLSTEHNEWFPTMAKNGNLYFTSGPGRTADIAYSPLENGKYEKVISLGDSVNSPGNDYDPIIAPDESYVVFSSNREGGKGSVDLYVSFRKEDGTWTKAKNLGDRVNTSTIEFAPRISNDGKYLFFNRRGDIWWIDTQVIWDLK